MDEALLKASRHGLHITTHLLLFPPSTSTFLPSLTLFLLLLLSSSSSSSSHLPYVHLNSIPPLSLLHSCYYLTFIPPPPPPLSLILISIKTNLIFFYFIIFLLVFLYFYQPFYIPRLAFLSYLLHVGISLKYLQECCY